MYGNQELKRETHFMKGKTFQFFKKLIPKKSLIFIHNQ